LHSCDRCLILPQRISEIIKRRNKERTAKAIALAKKEAMGDFSHLKNKKGEFIHQPLPQPTLPNISIDDDLADIASLQKRSATPSTNYTGAGDRYYAADAQSYDYPAMPAYNAPYSQHQDPAAYARYNLSVPTLTDDNQYYEDDYKSTTNLALAAEAHSRDDQSHYQGSQQGYVVDPYDVYIGNAANGHHGHQPGRHPHDAPDNQGLAYDAVEYTDHQTRGQHGYLPPNSQYNAGQFHAV